MFFYSMPPRRLLGPAMKQVMLMAGHETLDKQVSLQIPSLEGKSESLLSALFIFGVKHLWGRGAVALSGTVF